MIIDTILETEKNLIKVSGEVDMSSSPELRKVVLNAIVNSDEIVAIDLSAVKYMDSSGVATLIEGLKAAGRKKIKYVLLAPSKPVTEVFQLTKLDTVFDIRESL